jgi:biotin synthase
MIEHKNIVKDIYKTNRDTYSCNLIAKKLIDKLYNNNSLSEEELNSLLMNLDDPSYLFFRARELTDKIFGRNIYIRGLLEISNYCTNNCAYCGIRKDNKKVKRYRLKEDEILDICTKGYNLGFRTFVLQGGEDPYYSGYRMVEVVEMLREKFPDCAITLSIGERDKKEYEKLINAGADRFLLRHETIYKEQYEKFHPNMSYENRIQCLNNLRLLGYQTGTGFLLGLPGQKLIGYVKDLLFIKELEPHMVGIGPFIPHKDTPLGLDKKGSVTDTLIMLSIIRLLLPNALMPSSTALNTLSGNGYINGLNVGANVIMLNLTPDEERANYTLYEGKTQMDVQSKDAINNLKSNLDNDGYVLDMSRGDHINMIN